MSPQTAPGPAAFVATLGLAPQVITRGLDQLLARDPAIAGATVIYTTGYRPHPSWESLAAFRQYLERHYNTLTWHWQPITGPDGRPVPDVTTAAGAELAFKTIYNVTRDLKRQQLRLHTLLAGGRKSIVVYAMVTAQLLSDPQDHLWHLFSEDEKSPGGAWSPHPPLNKVHLVEIPVLHLAGLMPMVRQLIVHSEDPTRAVALYADHTAIERRLHLQRFWDGCDLLDRQIMWHYYRATPNVDIAAQLHLSSGAVTMRLQRVAERFFADPELTRLFPRAASQTYRTVLFILAPLLSERDEPPNS